MTNEELELELAQLRIDFNALTSSIAADKLTQSGVDTAQDADLVILNDSAASQTTAINTLDLETTTNTDSITALDTSVASNISNVAALAEVIQADVDNSIASVRQSETSVNPDNIIDIPGQDEVSVLQGDIALEIIPNAYVLSSAGMYGSGFSGAGIPTWLTDAIQVQLDNGLSAYGLTSVINGLVDSVEKGINQRIVHIEQDGGVIDAKIDSIKTIVDQNMAAAVQVVQTNVDANRAIAASTYVQTANFGTLATSNFLTNVTSYASDIAAHTNQIILLDSKLTTADGKSTGNAAYLQNIFASVGLNDDGTLWSGAGKIQEIEASVDDVSVRLQTEEAVSVGTHIWDGIETLTIGMKRIVNEGTASEYQETYYGGIIGWIETTADQVVRTKASLEATTGSSLAALQSQIDGEISNWFYTGAPTNLIEPESLWIAEDNINGDDIVKTNHLGDLYYDGDTGIAYRYSAGWVWTVITDTAITLALTNASKAQDTADGKRAIYYDSTIPTLNGEGNALSALDNGDMWVPANDVSTFLEGELQRYAHPYWLPAASSAGSQWSKSIENGTSKISLTTEVLDDIGWGTSINKFDTDIALLKVQTDGEVAYHFHDTDSPTLLNLPAVGWTTDAVRNEHLGDIYYERDAGTTYKYTLTGSTYSWEVLATQPEILKTILETEVVSTIANSKIVTHIGTVAGLGAKAAALVTLGNSTGDLYISTDTKLIHRFDGTNFVEFRDTHHDSAVALSQSAITALEKQVDGKISYYYSNAYGATNTTVVPTLVNVPASEWVTAATKAEHVGDIYYSRADKKVYKFQVVDTTYSWTVGTLVIPEVLAVILNAETIDAAVGIAKGTADRKTDTYTGDSDARADKQIVLADIGTDAIGDLWINTPTNTLWRFNGIKFIELRDNTKDIPLNTAVEDIIALQANTTGALTIFYRSGGVPTAMVEGDWYVNNIAIPMGAYRYESSVWVDYSTSIIGGSLIAAAEADKLAIAAKVVGEVHNFDNLLADWTHVSGTGEIVASVDSTYGTYAVSIGNNSGADGLWTVHNQRIPYDPTKLYRMTVVAKKIAGTGSAYFGVNGFAEDQTTHVNITGANTTSSQHYIAASGSQLSASYDEYTGYFSGHATSGNGGYSPDPLNPATLHDNVKYFSPLILVNYNNTAGTTLIDHVRIDEISMEAMVAKGVADGKAVIHYQATAPSLTLGDKGDLWVDTTVTPTLTVPGSNPAVVRPKNYTQVWSGSAWVSTATGSDAVLDNFIGTVYAQDMIGIGNQLDGVAVSYFQTAEPYTALEGLAINNADTWFNTTVGTSDANLLKRFTYINDTGTWVAVTNATILAAFKAAAKTKAAADRSIQNFTATPFHLFKKGDTWMDSVTGHIYVCKSDSAATYNHATEQEDHWELASKYTDDTVANRLVKIYSQDNNDVPTAAGINDVWIVTDSWYTNVDGAYSAVKTGLGFETRLWNGVIWEPVVYSLRNTLANIPWAGGASSFVTSPDGVITGWNYADGSDIQSTFAIQADNFYLGSASIPGYRPFSVDGTNVTFNGRVAFVNNQYAEIDKSSSSEEIFKGLNNSLGEAQIRDRRDGIVNGDNTKYKYSVDFVYNAGLTIDLLIDQRHPMADLAPIGIWYGTGLPVGTNLSVLYNDYNVAIAWYDKIEFSNTGQAFPDSTEWFTNVANQSMTFVNNFIVKDTSTCFFYQRLSLDDPSEYLTFNEVPTIPPKKPDVTEQWQLRATGSTELTMEDLSIPFVESQVTHSFIFWINVNSDGKKVVMANNRATLDTIIAANYSLAKKIPPYTTYWIKYVRDIELSSELVTDFSSFGTVYDVLHSVTGLPLTDSDFMYLKKDPADLVSLPLTPILTDAAKDKMTIGTSYGLVGTISSSYSDEPTVIVDSFTNDIIHSSSPLKVVPNDHFAIIINNVDDNLIGSVDYKAVKCDISPIGYNDLRSGSSTVIDGGLITTGKINSNHIDTTSLTASGLIDGAVIDGGIINGAFINGAVIKASYIDYTSNQALTNWPGQTTIPTVNLENFAKDADGKLLIVNGSYRLYTESPITLNTILNYNIPLGSAVKANVYAWDNATVSGRKLISMTPSVDYFDKYSMFTALLQYTGGSNEYIGGSGRGYVKLFNTYYHYEMYTERNHYSNTSYDEVYVKIKHGPSLNPLDLVDFLYCGKNSSATISVTYGPLTFEFYLQCAYGSHHPYAVFYLNVSPAEGAISALPAFTDDIIEIAPLTNEGYTFLASGFSNLACRHLVTFKGMRFFA